MRFYVVCIILQKFVFDGFGIPFPLTVVVMVAAIWLYTKRSGIKALVWTDTLPDILHVGGTRDDYIQCDGTTRHDDG